MGRNKEFYFLCKLFLSILFALLWTEKSSEGGKYIIHCANLFALEGKQSDNSQCLQK